MRSPGVRRILPHWTNIVLSLVAAGLLTLSFPDLELWFLAWIALVPLMWAIERENSLYRNFLLGWLFGTVYFFGTCWWLTYAPIHYAGMPWPIAYLLISIACLIAGIFPAIFGLILSLFLRKFGVSALLFSPLIWVTSEFARYWITGNDWNAVGYSQAFLPPLLSTGVFGMAALGGVLLISAIVVSSNAFISYGLILFTGAERVKQRVRRVAVTGIALLTLLAIAGFSYEIWFLQAPSSPQSQESVVAIQPNVPMSGLNSMVLEQLRQQQFDMAQAEIDKVHASDERGPVKLVILPESPMDFMYSDDREFQHFVRDFTQKNNVSILFNSAEPDVANGKYFNSAVMVGPNGKKIAEYDKVYLLPFGEAVPAPFAGLMPALVGSFSYGRTFPLLPVGDQTAGVMICFESHFGTLSREYVRKGADMLIELTNDGYLGPTPVLRQHLANAVFRAVETNRHVLRVTNVGITANIAPRGEICDSYVCTPDPYTQAARVWSLPGKSSSQTLYVRYGDWFPYLSVLITLVMLLIVWKRPDLGTIE